MNSQEVWDVVMEVRENIERARRTLQKLDPTALSMEKNGKANRIISHLSSMERNLNGAIVEAREIRFRLAGDVTIKIDEDGRFDPSDEIEP